MNFEEKRKKILENAEKTLGQGIEVNVIFDNDEIYDFLKIYKKFEKDSRKVRIWSK